MILYGSPDQIIPLASAFSTVVGLALVFWGKIIRAAHKTAGWLTARVAEGKKPHA